MSEKGFSLLEVMVSLLLISLVLFGLDAAELEAVQQAKTNYFYGVAANQLENMITQLISRKNSIDVSQLENIWNAENAEVLPNGTGKITPEDSGYVLSIFWGASQQQCKKTHLESSGCLTTKITA